MTNTVHNSTLSRNSSETFYQGTEEGFEDSFYPLEQTTPMADENRYFGGQSMEVPGSHFTSIRALREYVQELEGVLRNGVVPTEQKTKIQNTLFSLKGRLNSAMALPPAARQAALHKAGMELQQLEMRMKGTGTIGLEEMEDLKQDLEEGEGASLKNQLEETKKKIQADPNPSEKKKMEWTAKIDKWLSSLELGVSEEMESKIMDEFEAVQEDYANAALYTGAAGNLGELTDMEPGQIEALAKKHGVDLKNLPNPPDVRLAAMIAELPKVGELAGEVKSNYSGLQKKIESETSLAHSINKSNQNSNTSEQDSVDWTPFKNLYNAKFHRDDASQALGQARLALAKEVANVLGALYGQEVKAVQDPAKAGMVAINGTELNVLGKGGVNATVGFTTEGPEWPSVDLVQVYVDDEGDGKTGVPSWMREAHYPYHIYDTGGAAYSESGNWAWDGNVKDIGQEV